MANAEYRPAGRSFKDPNKPLGWDLLDHDVADRAKAIGVLRKAEELMRTNNPAPVNEVELRHALTLAAARVGVKWDEYERIVHHDEALAELERKVIADAIRRAWPPPAAR
jgi:hypothetical protein